MKIKSGSAYGLMVLMALMIAVIILSLEMHNFKSSFLPLVFSITIFILAAIRLRIELLPERKIEKYTDDDTAMEMETVSSWRIYYIAGAWVLGFVLAIYLLGFIPAIVLFTFFYMKTRGVSWLISISFTILIPVIIWATFELALRVNLYRGLIYTLLGY